MSHETAQGQAENAPVISSVTRYAVISSEGSDQELWCVNGVLHVRVAVCRGHEAAECQLEEAGRLTSETARRLLEEMSADLEDERWEAVWQNVFYAAPCDGSCSGAAKVDLREFIGQARAERLFDERFLPTDAEVEKQEKIFRTELDSEEDVKRAVSAWYQRRMEQADKDGRFLTSRLELDERAAALLKGEGPLIGVKFDSWHATHSGQGQSLCLGSLHVKISTDFTWERGDDGVFNTHRVTVEDCDGSCRPVLVEPVEHAAAQIRALLLGLRASPES